MSKTSTPLFSLVPASIDDVDEVVALLKEGFGHQPQRIWTEAFSRIAQTPAIDQRQVGVFLQIEGQLQGVLLTLRSRRPWLSQSSLPRSNISSWFVRDAARSQAVSMLRQVTRQSEATYIDLSPTQSVAKLSRLLGFQPITTGTIRVRLPWVVAARANGSGRVVGAEQTLGALTSEALHDALVQHRDWGCVVLGIVVAGKVHPIVCTVQRHRKTKLAGLRVIYLDQPAVLFDNLPRLARYLMARGWLFLELDQSGPLPDGLRYDQWSEQARIATAGYPPNQIDYLFSELVMFDFD